MWRVVLALVAGLGLAMIFALAQTVSGPLARLVRALLFGLVTMLGIAGLAIGVAGIADQIWWLAALGGGIVAVALRLGWGLRWPRRARAAGAASGVPLVPAQPQAPWQAFEADLDWVGRQQARRARKAIAAFVAERDSPSLTQEHRSLLLSCEKRVPELVQTCVERCRNASARERDSYIDQTLARLELIAAEADSARREVRAADDRRLQVLHRYFDRVAGEGEEPRNLP